MVVEKNQLVDLKKAINLLDILKKELENSIIINDIQKELLIGISDCIQIYLTKIPEIRYEDEESTLFSGIVSLFMDYLYSKELKHIIGGLKNGGNN